jgi:hypothetical protein
VVADGLMVFFVGFGAGECVPVVFDLALPLKFRWILHALECFGRVHLRHEGIG